MKSFEKLGFNNVGAEANASFMYSKLHLPSLVQLKLMPFLNMAVNGNNNSAIFGINLLIKFILPRKLWMHFLCARSSDSKIALTLSGSMVTPSLEIINPNSLPSCTKKHSC